ncbi:hypothetical protein BGX34_006415 [Mortierella sp. NVP85]|nr:hypothetical protein BGX34_006415 [Mortierella sp. NVP85]
MSRLSQNNLVPWLFVYPTREYLISATAHDGSRHTSFSTSKRQSILDRLDMVTEWVTSKTDGDLPNEQKANSVLKMMSLEARGDRMLVQDIFELVVNIYNDRSFAGSGPTFRFKQGFSEGQPLPTKKLAQISTECRTIAVLMANQANRKLIEFELWPVAGDGVLKSIGVVAYVHFAFV